MPADASPPQLLLVPTERHVDQAAIHGQKAVTLRRWTSDLADRQAVGQPITPETSRLLVAQVLGRSVKVGALVDEALGRLRRAGASAELLRATGQGRAQLLAEVWEAADAWLLRMGLRDPRADPWLVADRVQNANISELQGVSAAVVYGMSSWTGADLFCFDALHRALRSQSRRGLTLELPASTTPGGAALDPLLRSLETRWSTQPDPPNLRFIEPRCPKPELEVIEAPHEGSEARAAVHAVLEALRAGCPLDKLAIASIDLEEAFLEPLRFQLTAAGIPWSEPRGRPPIATPEAHAALELLRLARGALHKEALVDLLQAPALRAERWCGPGGHFRPTLVKLLKVLSLRVDRGGSDLEFALDQHFKHQSHDRPGAYSSEERARAEQSLRAIRGDLERLRGPLARSEFGRIWLEIGAELGLFSPARHTLEKALEVSRSGQPALLHALGEGARSAHAVRTAVERVVAGAEALGLGQQVITLDTFTEELELSLAGVGPLSGAPRAGALRIARPEELAGLELDQVIVCRASSWRLDWSGGTAGALLHEELLQALPASCRPALAAEQRRFRLLALTWLLNRSLRATVTFARRDAEGETAASRWVLELLAQGSRQSTEPASPLARTARLAAPLPVPSADARRRQQIELSRTAFFLDPEREPDAFTGHAGNLAPRLGGGAEHPIALTALERYARCPFAAFAHSVLGAAKQPEASDELGARERGISIHSALEAALEATRGKWGELTPEALEALALERARQYLEVLAHGTLHQAGVEALLEDVSAFLRRSLGDPEGLRFELGEQAFGREGPWTSLQVGPFHLSGRIDRIDLSSDRSSARVIDYKTGKKPTTREKAEFLLQPQLYSIKVGQELGVSQVQAGYLALEQREVVWSVVYEGPPDSEPTRHALSRSLALVADFRAGYVPPRPKDGRFCNRCEARSICRRPRFASELDEGD